MSEPLQVAFVLEGPTDFVMLKEIVKSVFGKRDLVTVTIQPQLSEAMKVLPGKLKQGWAGVCEWCLEASDEGGGQARDSALFENFDLLILQVDADVADKTYRSVKNMEDPFPNNPTLPCGRPCPPPSDTTDRLRQVALRWMGESTMPPHMVLCTPSKALETWVLVGLFPDHNVVKSGPDLECRNHPEDTLKCMPNPRRLVSGKKKHLAKYIEYAEEVAGNWALIKAQCSEAKRFDRELKALLGGLEG